MITWHKSFYGNRKADASKVYEEINSIGDTYTPKDIVNLARDEKTELHKLFDWDDSVAAERWRETQARYIVRCICVDTNEMTGKKLEVPIRAIVSTNERTKEYQPMTVVFKESDAYERLLNEALAELQAFQKKYKALKELEPVFDAIDEMMA